MFVRWHFETHPWLTVNHPIYARSHLIISGNRNDGAHDKNSLIVAQHFNRREPVVKPNPCWRRAHEEKVLILSKRGTSQAAYNYNSWCGGFKEGGDSRLLSSRFLVAASWGLEVWANLCFTCSNSSAVRSVDFWNLGRCPLFSKLWINLAISEGSSWLLPPCPRRSALCTLRRA